MKNHAADPEITFLTKSILKPYGRTVAIPTAWELNKLYFDKLDSFKHKLVKNLKYSDFLITKVARMNLLCFLNGLKWLNRYFYFKETIKVLGN